MLKRTGVLPGVYLRVALTVFPIPRRPCKAFERVDEIAHGLPSSGIPPAHSKLTFWIRPASKTSR